MNGQQVAGRHGSFMTQFIRPARSRCTTREAAQRAVSRKAVNRRLVLPLDGHQWTRAFEVLGARYARLGRTAEHYQAVVRDMVAHGKRSQERAAIAEALDRLREQAFAEEIPVSRSLWSTLVYAYCELGKAEEALEAFEQAQRRFSYSTPTLQYMAEMVLPVVCKAGQYDVASQLFEKYFSKDNRHSQQDRAKMQQWLAEAAARAGADPDKVSTLLNGSDTATRSAVGTPASSPGRTVHALFRDDKHARESEGFAETDRISHSPRAATVHSQGAHGSSADDELSRLSTEAVRTLLTTACADAERQLPTALRCWSHLFGHWEPQRAGQVALPSPRVATPSTADVHAMLNALVVGGHWEEAVNLFTRVFLGCGPASFLASASAEAEAREAATCSATPFDLPENEKGPLCYGDVPLDAVTLNLVFSAFPGEEVGLTVPGTGPSAAVPTTAVETQLRMRTVHHPRGVVRLLDVLLWQRDDVQMTDRVAAVVCGALIQLGQTQRALELLQRCPAFDVHPGKRVDMRRANDPAQRAVREQLGNLVYYLHACTTMEMRVSTLQRFPFLFPPEVFRHLPPPAELQHLLRDEQTRRGAPQTPFSSPTSTADGAGQSDEARFAGVLANKTLTSVRPSRHHYFPSRSSAVLTAAQEVAMQRDFSNLHATRHDAFRGSHADADKDPRPIPKGLHDHASGWDFFGRGGEMVFPNHRRTPHLLGMRPKVMRALADPYRSWNPKLNSSLAHKENVLKWNGKSAV